MLDTELPEGEDIEFIIKYLCLVKKGLKIQELPYIHSNQNEESSNTASNNFKFFYLGFKYFVVLIIFRLKNII